MYTCPILINNHPLRLLYFLTSFSLVFPLFRLLSLSSTVSTFLSLCHLPPSFITQLSSISQSFHHHTRSFHPFPSILSSSSLLFFLIQSSFLILTFTSPSLPSFIIFSTFLFSSSQFLPLRLFFPLLLSPRILPSPFIFTLLPLSLSQILFKKRSCSLMVKTLANRYLHTWQNAGGRQDGASEAEMNRERVSEGGGGKNNKLTTSRPLFPQAEMDG